MCDWFSTPHSSRLPPRAVPGLFCGCAGSLHTVQSGARLEQSAKQQTRKTQQGSLGEFVSSERTRGFKKMWQQICLFLLHLYRVSPLHFNSWLLYLRRQWKHMQHPRK